MKYFASLAVIFASALSVQAAEPVSARSLSTIGLSGMRSMSDAQGQQVRAKFAAVFGASTANATSGFTNATSTNGYVAAGGGTHGGVNVSAAYANGAFTPAAYSAAGGFSIAH
ncbi:hypothetical protein [Schlesneria paludicola]|uniref:hypothetical protein n=1 Tax=Schlesneria paludicola TaxID=360056 RepID=UPI0002F4B93E|nr:hypothetical protein [Schlesneria paludicola]